jgi:hypothetical protein
MVLFLCTDLTYVQQNESWVSMCDPVAAAELKRILEAQAKMVFRMNAWSTMAMLEPIQVARMHVASGHHPLRIHLLFLSGIFPKPVRIPNSPPST